MEIGRYHYDRQCRHACDDSRTLQGLLVCLDGNCLGRILLWGTVLRTEAQEMSPAVKEA